MAAAVATATADAATGSDLKKKPNLRSVTTAHCPCGSGLAYPACCGRYHQGLPAPTAEALMRARYSAYVLYDNAFIAATWHARTREAGMQAIGDESDNRDGRDTRWLGLDVRSRVPSGDTASVEFVARYKQGGRAHRLHEISRFVREAGLWWYVDGRFPKEESPR
jgi:SEC-C motif-containing protein